MNPLTVWLEIIDPLTGRAIIRETDRLPVISAVSGVAAALATFMKTEYIVGMWKDTLGVNICWHVEQAVTSRHEALYAPTWSWASVIGPVITQLTFHMCQLPQTKVVNVHHTLAAPNPYESVYSATLTISGILLNVSVSQLDPRPDDGTPF